MNNDWLMIDSCSPKWVDEFSVFICQKPSWFEWEIVSQRSFNEKKKICGETKLSHIEKRKKVGRNIKSKFGLF